MVDCPLLSSSSNIIVRMLCHRILIRRSGSGAADGGRGRVVPLLQMAKPLPLLQMLLLCSGGCGAVVVGIVVGATADDGDGLASGGEVGILAESMLRHLAELLHSQQLTALFRTLKQEFTGVCMVFFVRRIRDGDSFWAVINYY